MQDRRDIFEKCFSFTRHKAAKELGVYPYFRPLVKSEGSRVVIEGKPRIMLGSNNYLGLTHHPEVIAAAKAAIDEFGTGCTGSRMLNGTLELHNQLESGKSLADVAKTKGKSVDGLVDALVTDARKHLDEEVSEGDLTTAQADQILSRLEEGIRALVNGDGPTVAPQPGFGFRHEFDGPPSFEGAAA